MPISPTLSNVICFTPVCPHVLSSKPLILPFCLLIFAIALLAPNYAVAKFLENTVYEYLVIGIVLIFAISILILSNIKKRRKERIENEKIL